MEMTAATRAMKLPYPQGFLLSMPTRGAVLTGVFGVNPHDLPPGAFCLGSKDVQESSPACVEYTLRGTRTGQTDDVQVFMGNHPVFVDQPSRSLVVEVFALVGYFAVKGGNASLGFSAAGACVSARTPRRPG